MESLFVAVLRYLKLKSITETRLACRLKIIHNISCSSLGVFFQIRKTSGPDFFRLVVTGLETDFHVADCYFCCRCVAEIFFSLFFFHRIF